MSATLTSRLTRAADRWPEADAVHHRGETLSFSALHGRAARLAGWLTAQGVMPGDRVGIAMHRSLEMPVAVYGVLLAGAAYVPIDPDAPAARMAHILRDCDISVLISEPRLAGRIAAAAPQTGLRAVLGAGEIAGLETTGFAEADKAAAFTAEPAPEDICYIIFTSGSTGVPKGLTHTHASAIAFVDMAAALYALGPGDRMAAVSGLHFDMSCMEMFAGLLNGAAINLVPEPYLLMPASLAQLIDEDRLTTLYTVPFTLIRLAEGGALAARNLSHLRLIIHAGEPMSPRHLAILRQALPGTRFSNFYGPAEVNGVTHWTHPDQPARGDAAFPIGYPCAHTQLKIDGGGDTGELLIATPAMMQGYWRRPDLDATAFVTETDTDGRDRRYYRSGDIVRRATDGCLHFLGRADRQVKLRGRRVELDEIELAISSHAAVSEAAAVLSADGMHICAYAVRAPSAPVAAETEILQAAAQRLAAYAVPEHIHFLDAFPRTGSGKIDRKRLAMEGRG